MFTGIITHQWRIISQENGVFTIENPFTERLQIGQSIAHDGACMSVTAVHTSTYSFFVMQESFTKTNFSHKTTGSFFNLERCMQLSDKVDGHLVTGHIDSTGVITQLQNAADGSRMIGISFDTAFDAYCIPKWSIALQGISLTVVDTAPGYISVRLIPLTLQKTNLWNAVLWTVVNIEFDMMGKYALRYLQTYHPQLVQQ